MTFYNLSPSLSLGSVLGSSLDTVHQSLPTAPGQMFTDDLEYSNINIASHFSHDSRMTKVKKKFPFNPLDWPSGFSNSTLGEVNPHALKAGRPLHPQGETSPGWVRPCPGVRDPGSHMLDPATEPPSGCSLGKKGSKAK